MSPGATAPRSALELPTEIGARSQFVFVQQLCLALAAMNAVLGGAFTNADEIVDGRSTPQTAGAITSVSTAQPPDPFVKNSEWVSADGTVTLTVLEREGTTFRGRLETKGKKTVREMTGSVKGGTVSWLAANVRAVQGSPGGDNRGIIREQAGRYSIHFTWNGPQGRSGSFVLHRANRPGNASAKKKGDVANGRTPDSRPAKTRPASEPVLFVDFAADEGPVVTRATGVLLSLSPTEPADEYLVPLKPQLFRVRTRHAPNGWDYYERVHRLNAKFMVIMSDEFGLTHNYRQWPGDNNDWTAWENHCRDLVTFARQRNYQVIWDIWNEPNSPQFWKVGQARFLETWERGFRVIRNADPNAVITGPGISYYDATWMHDFLQYAKAHDVIPNVLNWHELGGADKVLPHVEQAKTLMRELGISIERIMLPEIIAPDRQFKPGHAVSYMAALNRAQIEAACHSCWPDPGWDGQGPKWSASNGWNKSLDGLLTFHDGKPRSCWWAFRAYADLSGRSVKVQPVASAFDGVASKESNGRAVVLVGRSDKLHSPPQDVTIALRSLDAIPNLVQQGTVHVLARSIPDSDFHALAEPKTMIDKRLTIRRNEIRLELPAVGPEHAYWVVLSR